MAGNDYYAILNTFVTGTVGFLSSETPAAKAEKAKWRHAFAAPVCENIRAWGLLQSRIPETLRGRGETPSYAETAAYMAIASYAACGGQADGVTLGQAAAKMGERQRDRFTRLENARTANSIWRELKGFLRMATSAVSIMPPLLPRPATPGALPAIATRPPASSYGLPHGTLYTKHHAA